jgi:hypothetical protein
MPPIRGNSLATVISSDPSTSSANPHTTDHLDARGRIYALCVRFRSVSGKPGGGSSPLIRMRFSSPSPPARIVAPVEDTEQSVIDPDGRRVVFDAGSHLHLAQGRRPWPLDHLETILTMVARPDYREDDPRPGRERFYRQNALQPGRWMRVVLDFNDEPGWVVTVPVQDDDPRPRISWASRSPAPPLSIITTTSADTMVSTGCRNALIVEVLMGRSPSPCPPATPAQAQALQPAVGPEPSRHIWGPLRSSRQLVQVVITDVQRLRARRCEGNP